MSGALTSYPRTSGGGGSSLTTFKTLIAALASGTAVDMEQAANDILTHLTILSLRLTDADMVALTIQARNVLAAASGKGQVAGAQYAGAMTLCAQHWKRVYPCIAGTGLAGQEQAVLVKRQSAITAVELRAAAEDAGTVAWLYEVSALLGEDVTVRLAHQPVPVAGTRYNACYVGPVLQYLECGASYNVNQFLQIVLPDPLSPPLIIAGEAKGGGSGYGTVKGPRAFMVSQGVASGLINQQDKLYPLSRAAYMAKANVTAPAGVARKQAGLAIERAGRDGMLAYLAVRGKIDVADKAVSSNAEVFKC